MPDITYQLVTGRWAYVVADGLGRLADPDTDPDEVGPTGKVEFVPRIGGNVSLLTGSPTRSVALGVVPGLVVDGVLRDLNGIVGVRLATKIGANPVYWTAKPTLTFGKTEIPAKSIEFGPGTDVTAQIHLNDLQGATDVYPAPVVGQAQTAALQAAQSAAAALAARIAAQEAATNLAGVVRKVNGTAPDAAGNVTVAAGGATTMDGITDAQAPGKALVRAASKSAARNAIDAVSQADIDTAIAALRQLITGGTVDAALDTLVEIVAKLGADDTALASLLAAVNDRYTKAVMDQRRQETIDALATKADANLFLQLLDNDFVKKAQKGTANGVASLDANGKVPTAQLPTSSGGGNDPRFTTPQAFTIGDGVTLGPYNLTHNGNSRASIVSVRQKKAPFKEIRLVDVAHPSLSALQIITEGKALPVCEVDVVLILGTTDATMPSTATVSLVSKTDTQVVLSATATDNVAVDYFNWFRDSLFIGTSPAGQNYTDTGRAPNTQYSYTATAVDTSGNESAAQSAAVQVTTNVSTTPPGFDTSQFASGNGNQSVNYAVPAGANRPVYALVSHINSGATGSSASVTIGGQPATLVDYKGSNGQAWVGVYKRDNVPGGASVTVAMTTGENYSSLLAFSYAPVASTAVLASVGGGGTTASSPSTAIAGNERLVSCYSTRENPTVTAGTLRASGNHTSGFQFIRVVEGAGASPQQNTVTMSASAAYACVNIKIAA